MENDMTDDSLIDAGRRQLLTGAAALAVATPLAGLAASRRAATGNAVGGSGIMETSMTRSRQLGTLKVSSVGLGVQNMSRTYQTTVPARGEMIDIIRTAFDRGLTFYDAAEAYGPLEVERILGEFLDLLAHFLGLGDKVIEEAAAISVSHAVLLLLVLGQTVCPSVPTLGLTRLCL